MKSNRTIVLLILGLLSAIGPFSIDMYLPAFETIATDFNSPIEHVQLSLTSYFIGIAIGQMIYGPLLDKYGRKKPLMIGLIIYSLASICCVFAHSVDQLIALRFLQALGSCAGMVAARAMVQDYYDSREAARVFSLLMLVIAISPILAPSAGAFLLKYFNWHYIFILLFAIAVIILICTKFLLPESYAGDRSLSLSPRSVFSKFWGVFVNKVFLSYCLVGSIASAGLYAYLAGSPFVMQQYYGLTQNEYGLAFAFVASAMIVATQLNRWLLKRWSSRQISKIANIWQAFIGLLMVISYATNSLTFTVLLFLMFFYLFGQGFIFPNTSALALSPFKASAGSASALLGCIQMGFGALTSALVSYLHNNTAMPMVAVMCGCAVIALILHLTVTNSMRKLNI